nr:MAG TPA: hypothetical protein [Ackermannviridae sp.]DAU77861.1 MAG TPA: hypothetical protein [Ackermannviridae sp.]
MSPVGKANAHTSAAAENHTVGMDIQIFLHIKDKAIIEHRTFDILVCLAGHDDIRLGACSCLPVGVNDQFPHTLVDVGIIEIAANLLVAVDDLFCQSNQAMAVARHNQRIKHITHVLAAGVYEVKADVCQTVKHFIIIAKSIGEYIALRSNAGQSSVRRVKQRKVVRRRAINGSGPAVTESLCIRCNSSNQSSSCEFRASTLVSANHVLRSATGDVVQVILFHFGGDRVFLAKADMLDQLFIDILHSVSSKGAAFFNGMHALVATGTNCLFTKSVRGSHIENCLNKRIVIALLGVGIRHLHIDELGFLVPFAVQQVIRFLNGNSHNVLLLLMRFCPKFIELLVSFVGELITIERHLIRRDRDFFTASLCRCGCFHMACALCIIDCLLSNCGFSLFVHALGKSFHAGVTIGFNRVNALFAKVVKVIQLGNIPDVVRVAVQRWVDFQNFIKSGNVLSVLFFLLLLFQPFICFSNGWGFLHSFFDKLRNVFTSFCIFRDTGVSAHLTLCRNGLLIIRKAGNGFACYRIYCTTECFYSPFVDFRHGAAAALFLGFNSACFPSLVFLVLFFCIRLTSCGLAFLRFAFCTLCIGFFRGSLPGRFLGNGGIYSFLGHYAAVHISHGFSLSAISRHSWLKKIEMQQIPHLYNHYVISVLIGSVSSP